ncbi:hypothetical protein TSAR_004644 [Trichomalopsis sarcophagae]|uniref:Uncharacterized protein n=1 Tax=Trichomalopsis sarcophagae TaxID=543379 RepID=A0A232EEQ4_9HYME|nr:hypothetical protein TSAR_004644 [Trichomalopsis sarcophagae]
MARQCTAKMFQQNNILVLEDSEHSFLILDKDLMESIRGSSPDEGVFDCDYNDEQYMSALSSVSNYDCNTATDNEVDQLLKEQKNVEESENNTVMQEHEFEKKIAMFHDETALALREMSENRRMISSVRGSIDEIDRALDYVEQSIHSTIYLKSAEMCRSSATVETQADFSSVETESWVVASIEALIQDDMNETDFSADSRKLQDHLQKRNTSDVDPRDLEIMHLKLMNKELKEQNERLKNKDYVEPFSLCLHAESNKLLKYELKLNEEKCEELEKEIFLLRTKASTIQVDLDNTKAELAEARKTISELQTQNSDLQKTQEISADVYNNRIEKQEIDILRFRATEKSYLYQIELLTAGNEILRDYIIHKFLKQ